MRFKSIIVAALFVVAGAACRGKHHAEAVQNEEPEPGPRIASMLKMSDPAAPAQLLHGFYGLEGNAWRWTAGKFSVLLRPPLAAAQRGATLTFAFSVPGVTIKRLGSFTLTAASGATVLKSETISKTGANTLIADVPAELLLKETMTIDFAMDKSIPAGAVDQRELGVIATSVGLESK